MSQNTLSLDVNQMKPRKRVVMIMLMGLVVCVGGLVRIWLSTLHYNFDVEQFKIVADLVAQGKNVYANTTRYNYGPVWAGILWILQRIEQALGHNDIARFHVIVAAFLTVIDIAIALIITRRHGYLAGVLFFLCPVSILITGVHSQFDNVAILLALCSWAFLDKEGEQIGLSPAVTAGILMGVSLAVKHIMIFFPLWILVSPSLRWSRRIIFCILSYVVFLGSFIPFAQRPEDIVGINNNVFHYNGMDWFGNGLLPRLLEGPQFWVAGFAVGMIVSGFAIACRFPRHLFYLYPVALLVFSPTMTDQYLAIPVISYVVYRRNVMMWAYVVIAAVLLIGSTNNIGSLSAMRFLAEPIRSLDLTLSMTSHSPVGPQIILAVFLMSWYVDRLPKYAKSVLSKCIRSLKNGA